MPALKVRVVSQYGNERVFPACPQSLLLAELIGKQTFSKEHLGILARLGYTLEPVTPDLQK